MFKKKTEKLDYFDEFIKLAEWGVESAEFLKLVLEDYPVADLSQKLDEMHEIEHNADLAKYRLMRYMYNDLLPPFDRQGVIALVTSLDHAIDIQSMRDLYQSDADAVSIVIRSKIYKSLEDCCDAFKDVTKFVEEIALKYA